jgi:hypothetical protein
LSLEAESYGQRRIAALSWGGCGFGEVGARMPVSIVSATGGSFVILD